MKISCVPVSFFPQIISGTISLKEIGRIARKFGLDAVDISVALLKNRDKKYLKKIRKDIEDEGIHIASIMAYTDFTNPDEAKRKEEKINFGHDVADAALLGAKYIRITAGKSYQEISRKQGINWAVEGILNSEKFGVEHGVKILYENHAKPSVWDYPDFSLPTDIFLEIADRIKNTEINILFDTANPLVYGDNPCDVLGEVIDRVECLHFSDIKRKGKQEPVIVGTGIVPFDSICDLLHHSGFNGLISIEEASGYGEIGLKKSVDFTKKLIAKHNL